MLNAPICVNVNEWNLQINIENIDNHEGGHQFNDKQNQHVDGFSHETFPNGRYDIFVAAVLLNH